MKRSLRVGIAQIHSVLGNVELNLEKHLSYIEKAKERGVDILVFPELSLTGYLLKDIAYEISEDAEKALAKIEEVSPDICLAVGLVRERRLGVYENSVAYICGGKTVGFYSKLYLPSYGLFEEARYFGEGLVEEVRVFEWQGWRLGSVICEDAWHPEPAELVSRLGADIIVIHSASPIRGLYGSGKTLPEKIWESIVVTRAVENSSYVLFVNSVGPEDEEFFWGGSMVVAPSGEVLARAGKMEEQLLVADINVNLLRAARRFSSFKIHRRDIHELLSLLG